MPGRAVPADRHPGHGLIGVLGRNIVFALVSGLAEGDVVVTGGQLKLRPGVPVQVVGQPPAAPAGGTEGGGAGSGGAESGGGASGGGSGG